MPLVSEDPTTCELPDLKLVGTCTFAEFFADGQQKLFGETWERFMQQQVPEELVAHPGRWFGLELYPPEFPKIRRWYYFACAEVKDFEAVYPPSMVARFIPASQYLKFTVAGPVTELAPAFHFIYHNWLPGSGIKLAKYYDLEFYDERFKGACDPASQIDILLPLA
jgi:predicted transcriptional regulator YdeE